MPELGARGAVGALGPIGALDTFDLSKQANHGQALFVASREPATYLRATTLAGANA